LFLVLVLVRVADLVRLGRVVGRVLVECSLFGARRMGRAGVSR
jgi:hypothetical protein